jgi:hypothetical protein
MKLHELRDIGGMVELKEGIIPPHISMTLDQVVTAGKITNPVQKFMMANLVNMFKNGGPNRWPRELNGSQAGTEVIDAIGTLSDTEQIDLAKWLLQALQEVADYDNTAQCPYHSPEAKTADWAKWVSRKK